MSNGRLFLATTPVICLGSFVSGIRFVRMKSNPWAGKRILGQSVSGSAWPIERVRLFGWIQLITAPPLLLFAAALAFGLFGPVDGISTISLH